MNALTCCYIKTSISGIDAFETLFLQRVILVIQIYKRILHSKCLPEAMKKTEIPYAILCSALTSACLQGSPPARFNLILHLFTVKISLIFLLTYLIFLVYYVVIFPAPGFKAQSEGQDPKVQALQHWTLKLHISSFS